MRYLPPFELLKSGLPFSTLKGKTVMSGTYEDFVVLVRRLISGISVDEKWYLKRYPDIAQAIQEGLVSSAPSHFVNNGYFEGRLPFEIKIDEPYYLLHYPDLANEVRKGTIASGQQHFDENGYAEGRLPFGL